jgi:hypothetical protein
VSGFRIQSYASPDHSIARPFESRKKSPVTSLDRFIKKSVIRNILFMSKRSRLVRKNIRSGFQMVSAILFLPLESRTNRSSPDHLKVELTSLDRFGMNKIFFLMNFILKRSSLMEFFNHSKARPICPVPTL